MYLNRAFLLFAFLAAIPCLAGERNVLLRDDFDTLAQWEPFYFPNIKQYSTYSLHTEGDNSVLKAESSASASALVYKEVFSVYDYPCVRWRWKVENIYSGGDARIKKGDDYAMRVYIFFLQEPSQENLFEKARNTALKFFYGAYPPHSTLNYIWANREHAEPVLTNTYTSRSKLIPLRAGRTGVGVWHVEKVNIVKDYLKAFGSRPPTKAGVAIMNDSDNTGEHSVSYLDYIEVYREMENNDS
jgi:hypothetical protein